MKQEQQLFSGITASLITLLLIAINYQYVYTQNKSDSFICNKDMNNLLLDTKLVEGIEINRPRSRNHSKVKRNERKPVQNASLDNLSNYDASIIYQSKVILRKQNKLEPFKTGLNELDITRLNISPPLNNQFIKSFLSEKFINKGTVLSESESVKKQNKYWATLHFIESSSGKRLYRKRNKARSCKWTTTPCGHHQLSVKALKDIGCKSLKCRSAREDYKQSLSMSKKLETINAKRMKKKGYKSLPEYQRYLVHQQGASGLGRILDALKGKKSLSKKMLKYMANNSPYSYKNLRESGYRGAARKFLNHWEEKWKVTNSRRLASR